MYLKILIALISLTLVKKDVSGLPLSLQTVQQQYIEHQKSSNAVADKSATLEAEPSVKLSRVRRQGSILGSSTLGEMYAITREMNTAAIRGDQARVQELSRRFDAVKAKHDQEMREMSQRIQQRDRQQREMEEQARRDRQESYNRQREASRKSKESSSRNTITIVVVMIGSILFLGCIAAACQASDPSTSQRTAQYGVGANGQEDQNLRPGQPLIQRPITGGFLDPNAPLPITPLLYNNPEGPSAPSAPSRPTSPSSPRTPTSPPPNDPIHNVIIDQPIHDLVHRTSTSYGPPTYEEAMSMQDDESYSSPTRSKNKIPGPS